MRAGKKYANDSQADAARGQAIASLLGQAGQGIGAAAPALQAKYDQWKQRDTVAVPDYSSAAGPYANGYKF